MASVNNQPQSICWTIAGSDGTGGAGVQADLKTMHALGVHGCSVITAITAQNSKQVVSWQSVSPDIFHQQIDALMQDYPPQVVKIGMLGSMEVVDVLIPYLDSLRAHQCKVVWDPVLSASTGDALWSGPPPTPLLPFIDVLTPNIREAELFWGRSVKSWEDMESAAQHLRNLGVGSVLIKGGHVEGAYCSDFWTDGKEKFWLTSQRQNQKVPHGTGCTLSSAIVACLVQGFEVSDALVVAKTYINQSIRNSSGNGLLLHEGWPESPDDMPWLTQNWTQSQQKYEFKDCTMGFYPIVSRSSWVERLLELGVNTIQLRIKDLNGAELEEEIALAVALARQYQCQLFINDYWDLAIKHCAYGVHLGQEDLDTADLRALEKAGVRLGISTHSYAEIARALSIRPSYVAVGPVYHTTCKSMRFCPQGLDRLRRFRKLLKGQVVAIGGISLDLAPAVLATGVDGVAVISDVVNASDLEGRVAQWLASHSLPKHEVRRRAKAGARGQN